MKRTRFHLPVLVPSFCLGLLLANHAAAQPSDTNSDVPTGNFVAIQSPFPITLKLETNGTYEVRFGGQFREFPGENDHTQRGTWTWNSQSRELLLNPRPVTLKTNDVWGGPDLRRLRIDPQDSRRLQWIPGTVGSSGGGTGVIDYVTFKPKKD